MNHLTHDTLSLTMDIVRPCIPASSWDMKMPHAASMNDVLNRAHALRHYVFPR